MTESQPPAIPASLPGTPAFRLTNQCIEERYEISKVILGDPSRPVLLQQVTFRPMRGDRSDYRLYALLAPHVSNQGDGNSGRMGNYKGTPMLFRREGEDHSLAACSAPFAVVVLSVVVKGGYRLAKREIRLHD